MCRAADAQLACFRQANGEIGIYRYRPGVSFPHLSSPRSLASPLLASMPSPECGRFPDPLPDRWTLAHWQNVAETAGGPIMATLWIALLTTLMSLVLVVCVLENERQQNLRSSRVSNSWSMYHCWCRRSASSLVWCCWRNWREFLQWRAGGNGPCDFRFTLCLSFAFKAYRRQDPAWTQIARTLGQSAAGALWRVRLPMLLTPLLTAFAVGAAISIGQYLVTRLLGAGRSRR